MNQEQARALIRETFQNDFSKERFARFIKNFLKTIDGSKAFHLSGALVRRAFQDKVSSYERIGQFTDKDGKKIDVLIVNLSRDTTLERGRTALRDFAADYLESERGADKAAVLVAYVSASRTDWRFSFVALEKSLVQNERGVFVEQTANLTHARRKSFLVGRYERTHTAQTRFLKWLENSQSPTLAEIEACFDVESVTKEFFQKYKTLFERTRDALLRLCEENEKVRREFIGKGMFAFAKDENGADMTNERGEKIKIPQTDDFAKKLLGQIVFLYFLQKKGWFGVRRDEAWGTGDKNFLRTLFAQKSNNQNFFNDVLEPLFYNALAVKRQHDWSDRFSCKIPFLNGGLFEPVADYDWVHLDINLPDELFSDKPNAQDEGAGILDVFDLYNFTINEAEPLEIEVAVDPEMLGKIFENLLPENIRHGSGTYYTPRVIVAYMCQQSLVNYLATHLAEVAREEIETLIRFGAQAAAYTHAATEAHREKRLPASILKNAKRIDELLARITVCDPAIGSGAFPVGMMQEIVRAREALQQASGVAERTHYELKRQAIENSLYGVDIDSGAVEIAKLRLWLSLIVDEADYRNIAPLPNLDYKIMQGNSLLDEFHGVKLIDEKMFAAHAFDREARVAEINAEIDRYQKDLKKANVGRSSPIFQLTERRIKELLDEKRRLADTSEDKTTEGLFAAEDETQKRLNLLKQKHREIFNEFDKERKERLRREAERLDWEFIRAKLEADGKRDELAELESRRHERRKNYFLWQLNFPEIFERGGFDVVIGNPPYIRIQELEEQFVQRIKVRFEAATGKFDTYVTFIEQGINLLNAEGTLAFINPNKFFNSSYGIGIRKIISKGGMAWRLIDFGESQVFENATTYTCLLFLSRRKNEGSMVVKPKFI